MAYRKKLIEVALPLDAINREAAREKSIRHGHPSTLHLWWARRPLAACRAVLFASLVDDPSSHPEKFPTEEAQEAERQRLFRIIEELVKWENTTNENVLNAAREEILKSTGGNPPPVLDPFCGGGSIPLEAQRLGLKAYASDLNPVAVLITKALIEIPPRFAGQPPVHLGARASRPQHRGWYSRGHLPHFDEPGLMQMLTFRLHDALPPSRRAEWQHLLKLEDDIERRKQIEAYLDKGYGSCSLRDDRMAQMVENALLHFDGARYRLIAWVVMPNHVHALIATVEGHPLDKVLHSWKSFTAKEANKLLGRSGAFWQLEYFDRFIRDERHFYNAIDYIHNNPVKAGLVQRAEDWLYSSARPKPREAAGETPALPGIESQWPGARGLAEDVRYYGKWMRDEAEKRIGHLYPKVRLPGSAGVSPAEATVRLPGSAGVSPAEATVIAWLWARTVKCPNPACGATMPLVRSFALSTKPGKKAWVEPVVDKKKKAVSYEVKTGNGAPPDGTVNRRGARCIVCSESVSLNHVRAEGRAGRMSAQLMAIVAEGKRQRVYLPPSDEHTAAAAKAEPSWRPHGELPKKHRNFQPPGYGMSDLGDLFTQRQLVTLSTLSDLVSETRKQVWKDALATGLDGDDVSLEDGGRDAAAYADAVVTYLSLGVSKLADYNSSLVVWSQSRDQAKSTFARQALPMVWDYVEVNPFAEAAGDLIVSLGGIAETIEKILPASCEGITKQLDAGSTLIAIQPMTSTDPPYYDNIAYADLSDFFYVWLRRSLGKIYPQLFSTVLVPKAQELIAASHRFNGDKEKAEEHFLTGLGKAFRLVRERAHPHYPVTVYYAFKQSEEDENDGKGNVAIASTGWETMLEGLMQSGFIIAGTWPMRTERGARSISIGANALASSIVLVCRPRVDNAPMATRREFISALRRELPDALKKLQHGNIAPVDFAQATIGPGMAVFSRYAKVIEADGSAMRVRTALQLINEELDAYFAEQEGELDPDTRFCIAWFEQRGMEPGAFGEADVLARAKNTAVEGLVRAGVLEAKAGKVRLLRREEYADDWNPAADDRLTVWECAQHLIRALQQGGEEAAARLANQLGGGRSEEARALAYRLYAICERKGWAQEALAYNTLVASWSDVQTKTASLTTVAEQSTFGFE